MTNAKSAWIKLYREIRICQKTGRKLSDLDPTWTLVMYCRSCSMSILAQKQGSRVIASRLPH